MKKVLVFFFCILLFLSCAVVGSAAVYTDNRLFKIFTPEIFTGMLNENIASVVDLLYPTIDKNSRENLIASLQLYYSETDGTLFYYDNEDWLVELSAYYNNVTGSRYDPANTITFSFPMVDVYYNILGAAFLAVLCGEDETLDQNQLAEYTDCCCSDFLRTDSDTRQKAYTPLIFDGFVYEILMYKQENMNRCAITLIRDIGGAGIAGVNGKEYIGSLYGYTPISFSNASATSELEEGDIRFIAGYAIDPNMNRPWVEGVSGDGIGQSITMQFAKTETIQVLGFQIGYARSQDYYSINNRPQKVHISFSDGSGFDYTFRDTLEEQCIQLSQPIETGLVKVEILDVYSGSMCKDTCIYLVRAFQ